jgi:hypothetical protein
MPVEGALVSELEALATVGEVIAAVVLSIAAYLTAKLRLGWWPPRRPHR